MDKFLLPDTNIDAPARACCAAAHTHRVTILIFDVLNGSILENTPKHGPMAELIELQPKIGESGDLNFK